MNLIPERRDESLFNFHFSNRINLYKTPSFEKVDLYTTTRCWLVRKVISFLFLFQENERQFFLQYINILFNYTLTILLQYIF